jgi:hypothetical protein
MDALRRHALTVWPGMTIYWIGDPAHQTGVSGHNPDDTPGVQAELTDADNDPEVRSLDFMIGPQFTSADGQRLVTALTTGVDKYRVFYVIFQSKIYSRTGFSAQPYSGANHNDHVHVSGYVTDDANGADWQSVLALGGQESDMAHLYKTPVGYYISNGIHRRGPIRTKSPFFTQATIGMTTIGLTEEQRVAGAYPTWEAYLDAVAGPLFPQLVCNCNCDGGGSTVHTHDVTGTTGPATPTG